jgi:hypothetical protein
MKSSRKNRGGASACPVAIVHNSPALGFPTFFSFPYMKENDIAVAPKNDQ